MAEQTIPVVILTEPYEVRSTGRNGRGRQSDLPTTEPGVVLEVSTFHHGHGKCYLSEVYGTRLGEGGLVRTLSLFDSREVARVNGVGRFSGSGITAAHRAALATVFAMLRDDAHAFDGVLAKTPKD